jgi:hypothetical protein
MQGQQYLTAKKNLPPENFWAIIPGVTSHIGDVARGL